MKRRLYSFLIACIGFTFVAFAQEKPLWEKQLNEINEKIIQYVDGEKVVIFPIITDMHIYANPVSNLDHIDRVVESDALLSYDFITNLGDYGLELGETTDKAEVAEFLMSEIKKRHNRFSGVTLFARGNHELNHKKGGESKRSVSQTEWASRFTESQRRKNPSMVTQESYGYYDILQSKIRVFFLDTQTIDYYGISEKQLQFLSDGLQIKEDGWQVIILTHFCADPIGMWKSAPADTATNGYIYKAILKDFQKKGKGNSGQVKWDFRKNKSSVLVANFCGDSHFDNHINRDGVNIVISQGYGFCNPNEIKDNEGNPVYTGRGPEDMMIDIVVIKPDKREFNIYRWGAGEDRAGFKY